MAGLYPEGNRMLWQGLLHQVGADLDFGKMFLAVAFGKVDPKEASLKLGDQRRDC